MGPAAVFVILKDLIDLLADSTPQENAPSITHEAYIEEMDRNYNLGLKHGREEKADLLDWAETLLCSSRHPSGSSNEEWAHILKRWRYEKHGVKQTPKGAEPEPAPRNIGDVVKLGCIREDLQKLANECNCRLEHGAGGAHLIWFENEIKKLIGRME